MAKPEAVPIPSIAQDIYSRSPTEGRLYQSELLVGIQEWVPSYDDNNQVRGTASNRHLLAIILTQDCDLEQDWRVRQADLMADTDLRSIMFSPAQSAVTIKEQQVINSTNWKPIVQNKVDRYQYLAKIPSEITEESQGHPPIVLDFKSYFSIPTKEVYRQASGSSEPSLKRLVFLNTPWREHLQARFFSFQARIGLSVTLTWNSCQQTLYTKFGKV